MNWRQRRLLLQILEDRTVPAVTASVVNGSLIVRGDSEAASQVAITASDSDADGVADTFKVVDGSTTVGTFSNVTRDVILRLSDNDDTVSIDLGGLSTPRNIRADLGDGTKSLSIDNGTVKGFVNINGGAETDTVTLGGTAELTISGNAYVNLGDAADDVLHLGQVTVEGSLAAYFVNNITADEGSTVERNFIMLGGTGGNTVDLSGAVEGNVVFSSAFGSTAGNTFNLTGDVDGSVAFYGSNQADTLNTTGNIGGNLLAQLGGGDDTATIGGAVTRRLDLDGGAGADTMTVSGAVGGRAAITGGAGNDTLNVTATAKFSSSATVNLGAGDDKFTFDDAATITTLLANGGSGSDTFTGTKTRTGLTIASIELP